MKIQLNDNWTYFKEWSDEIPWGGGGNGVAVRLPHCNTELPFNCFSEELYCFVSGYRTRLQLQPAENRKFLLTIGAAAHKSVVYVNGTQAAEHKCGYTAFTVDITPLVKQGENVIAVKVDSTESPDVPPFGNTIDYLTYGGIYREVCLDVKDGVYVKDVFVTALPDKPVKIEIALGNSSGDTLLSVCVKDGEKVVFSSSYTVSGDRAEVYAQFAARLWEVDNPQLYRLEVTAGKDLYTVNFGVRSAEFRKNGFFLNGHRVKIIGLNRHQSYPYVGYAMPESMQRLDAEILKNELCVNAVRTSHYPQSVHFIDACDRLGLLVFTEIPGWQHIGDKDWQEQALKNTEDMVLQYRNHPSVILWGVRINESLDCDGLYSRTNEAAHKLDSTRMTGGVRYLRRSHLLEDVYTYNDFNRFGTTDRKKVCDKNVPYLITEYNGHMFPTKTFDDEAHRREHMLRYARMLDGVFADDNICGAFGWCMSDYNTHADFGSGDRICYHGVTDMFRNPKYAAGVFSAQGRKDFLSLCFTAASGDYAESVSGDLYCITNADSVRIYKGGKYIKTYTYKDTPFKHLPNAPILIDDLIGSLLETDEHIKPVYAKRIKKIFAEIKKRGEHGVSLSTKLLAASVMVGAKLSYARLRGLFMKYEGNWGGKASEIRAEAYRGGKLVAKTTLGQTKEWKINISVSSHALTEKDTYDVAAVRITAVDDYGILMPYVSAAVRLRCTGAVELIGPSVVPFTGGCCGAYVKTRGTGEGTLYVNDTPVLFEVTERKQNFDEDVVAFIKE